MDGKTQNGGKNVEEPKMPQYKNGKHPSIKDGFRHTKLKEPKPIEENW
jgi:hypothetical protein